MKYYTPKKQRNNYDENNYIYYHNESTTIGLTGKKSRKLIVNKTEQKTRKVYTNLEIDNVEFK